MLCYWKQCNSSCIMFEWLHRRKRFNSGYSELREAHCTSASALRRFLGVSSFCWSAVRSDVVFPLRWIYWLILDCILFSFIYFLYAHLAREHAWACMPFLQLLYLPGMNMKQHPSDTKAHTLHVNKPQPYGSVTKQDTECICL